MQNPNLPDTNYRLIPAVERRPAHNKLAPRIWLASLLTLTLIAGALYAPVLWKNEPINAAPPARLLEAQTLQVDASLLAYQDLLANLYEQVAPSVVSIQVTSDVDVNANGFPFPNIPGLPEGELPQQRGEGSGFLYDNDDHIVTNHHVVEGATTVNVIFNDGNWARAEVVATDPQADLAVLKVTPPAGFAWRPLSLATPESLKVGHTVIAMGNPFGLEGTMTTGIVSAMGRGLPVGALGASRYTLPDVIQTDAAINPGNSGGPLVNLAGEVVGVNFAIESATRSNSGVGFTIPVSIVQRVVPALIENGRFDYAYLGLSGVSIGPDVAEELDLAEGMLGVYVGSVVPGGPSDEAGVQGGASGASTGANDGLQPGGDIVIAINEQPVRRFEDLVSYLVTRATPGDTVTLTLVRDGEQQTVEVVLGTRPGVQETPQAQIEGPISARQAIRIAREAVEESLTGPVTETLVSPERVGGQEVWVVELSTEEETATITVSRTTGEVLSIEVE
jgi:2-alkenal reductase